jgi:hypothetical protein
MMDELLPFLDLGGTLAFAAVVWWELKSMRTELSGVLTGMVERLSTLEERTRVHADG